MSSLLARLWLILAVCLCTLLLARAAQADESTGVWPTLSVPAPQDPLGEDDAAVIVGIDAYDTLPRVQGAADNARDWEKYFLFTRKILPRRVKLVTDKSATEDVVRNQIKEVASEVGAKGTLWFVFIGHGTPSKTGEGLLLMADARDTEQSFETRSIAQSALVELLGLGKQAHTMIVLDACFSGLGAEGKQLLKGTQMARVVKPISAPQTSVFTAGRSDEYAGRLPGGLRPAYSYMLLGGLRGWADANGDGKVTVQESADYTSLLMRSLPNNHEQHPELKSAEPDAPLSAGTSEKGPDLVVLRQKVEQWTPPKPPRGPEIRVAVSCMKPTNMTSDDGIVVTVDGAAATPREVKKGPDGAIEYVSFETTPGTHQVRIAGPDCAPLSTTVFADDNAPARIDGALGSSEWLLGRSPAAKPDFWNVSVGMNLRGMLGGNNDTIDSPTSKWGIRFPTVIPGAEVGLSLVSKFFYLTLVGEFGGGQVVQNYTRGNADFSKNQYDTLRSFTRLGASMSGGFRLPLKVVTIAAGPRAGLGNIAFSEDVRKDVPDSPLSVVEFNAGGELRVFVHATCAFGFQASGFATKTALGSFEGATLGGGVSLFLQPSEACSDERVRPVGLRANQEAVKP